MDAGLKQMNGELERKVNTLLMLILLYILGLFNNNLFVITLPLENLNNLEFRQIRIGYVMQKTSQSVNSVWI